MAEAQPPADSTPDEVGRQRLVAYLDGELSDEESRAVERDLALDEAARTELQGLDRVWNALDALPRSAVDESFTRSTVELVAVKAQRDVERLTTALPVQRRRRGYRMLAACVAALLVGVVVARGMATRNDRRVLADLPVIYQVDALGQFRDPGFLRTLRADAAPLLAEFEDDAVRQQASDWLAITAGSPPARASWVRGLSNDAKLRLQRAAGRFADDSRTAREAARDLQARLSDQEDAEQLFTTAIAYQAWLATQTPPAQSRLRQIDDPAARVAEIQRMYRDDRFRSERTLSAEDSRALRRAIRGLSGSPELERLRDTIRNKVRTEVANRFGGRGERPEASPARRWVAQQQRVLEQRFGAFPAWPIAAMAELVVARPDGVARPLQLVFRADLPKLVEQARRDWPPIERALVEALGETSRQRLAKLRDERRRVEQLRAWVVEAARDATKPDDDLIEAFFASDALTDTQRHELLALPTEEMKRRLRRVYVDQELGGGLGLGDDARRFPGWGPPAGDEGRGPRRPSRRPGEP